MDASKWKELRARLLDLGWRDETTDGIVGLSSPNDAMFIDARALEAEFGASMMSSLRRQVATIEGYKEQGFYPPEAERAHHDFQQALACLAEVSED